MTRDEISAMKPGLELDALVQTTFFETKYMCHIDGCLEDYCCLERDIHNCSIAEDLDGLGLKREDCSAWKMVEPKHYSTDISAAWEVVEKMKLTHWLAIESDSDGLYYCIFTPFNTDDGEMSDFTENAAESICKAALLASVNNY